MIIQLFLIVLGQGASKRLIKEQKENPDQQPQSTQETNPLGLKKKTSIIEPVVIEELRFKNFVSWQPIPIAGYDNDERRRERSRKATQMVKGKTNKQLSNEPKTPKVSSGVKFSGLS